MPIEIRELVIEGSLSRPEDREAHSTQLLTTKDIDDVKREVAESIRSEGALSTEQRQELIDDILREVRKMLDDRWRR